MEETEKLTDTTKPQKKLYESVIRDQIFYWLRSKDVFVFRNPSSKRNHRQIAWVEARGTSDLIGILPDGRFLAIEVRKALTGFPWVKRRFIEKVVAYGGMGMIVFSLEEVKDMLKGYVK